MPYPTKYTRQYDYQSYQNSNPTRPLPGGKVNVDLDAAKLSIGEIVDFLKGVMRPDGKLANGIVGIAQLDSTFQLGFSVPTLWEPGVDYTADSTVLHDNKFWHSKEDHTSTDGFDESKWDVIVDFGEQADLAAASVDAAAASEAAAGGSAATATTKAGEAAGSAATATTKAGEAAASAVAAAESVDSISGTVEYVDGVKDEVDADRVTTEAARDAALAAVASVPPTMSSRAYAMASYRPFTAPDVLRTLGYADLGDLGDADFESNGTTSGDLVLTLADGVTQAGYDRVRKLAFTPQTFGANASDTAANQRAAIQACMDFAPEGATIDLGGTDFTVDATLKPRPGQRVWGGGLLLAVAVTTAVWGVIAAADFGVYENLKFVGTNRTGTAPGSELYQAAIHSSTTALTGRIPAKNVKVHNCDISKFTVGVASNPADGEAVATNWRVTGCNIHDIVGYTGASEGYGVSFGYGTNIWVNDNAFLNIKRHAVYYSGVNGGHVIGNDIQYVDNIGIQFNGYSAQPYSYANIIAFNRVANITRLVDYGYTSAVAIGIYGKQAFTEVIGNSIQSCVHGAIDLGGQSGDTSVTGSRYFVNGNDISLDTDALSFGIHTLNAPWATISNNNIRIASNIWAILLEINADVGSGSWPLQVTGNTLSTGSGVGGAFKVNCTHSSGRVRVYRNDVFGFSSAANHFTDSSTAGIIRSDMNRNVGYINTNADVTHNAGGSADVDRPTLRLAEGRSATRNVYLGSTDVPNGATVRIANKTTGGFGQTVYSGGAIATLAVNESCLCAWNGAAWELVMKGTA